MSQNNMRLRKENVSLQIAAQVALASAAQRSCQSDGWPPPQQGASQVCFRPWALISKDPGLQLELVDAASGLSIFILHVYGGVSPEGINQESFLKMPSAIKPLT
jgi:hypothetical protein